MRMTIESDVLRKKEAEDDACQWVWTLSQVGSAVGSKAGCNSPHDARLLDGVRNVHFPVEAAG